MLHCKPVSTLLSTSKKLSIEQGNLLGVDDATKYRSIVEAHLLTLIRLDNAFSFNKVRQFLHPPIDVHW
jgi:hypothetical protein